MMNRDREKDRAVARLMSWMAAKDTVRYAEEAPKIIKEIEDDFKKKWPDEYKRLFVKLNHSTEKIIKPHIRAKLKSMRLSNE